MSNMLNYIDFTTIQNIYGILSIPFGWIFISKIQRNFVIFTTIGNYVIVKLIFATFTGWLVTPFYVLGFIYRIFTCNKSNRKSKSISRR